MIFHITAFTSFEQPVPSAKCSHAGCARMSAPRYEEIRFARPANKPGTAAGAVSAAELRKKAAAKDEGLVRELYKRLAC